MEWWSKKIMGHSLLQEKWDLTLVIGVAIIKSKQI